MFPFLQELYNCLFFENDQTMHEFVMSTSLIKILFEVIYTCFPAADTENKMQIQREAKVAKLQSTEKSQTDWVLKSRSKDRQRFDSFVCSLTKPEEF